MTFDEFISQDLLAERQTKVERDTGPWRSAPPWWTHAGERREGLVPPLSGPRPLARPQLVISTPLAKVKEGTERKRERRPSGGVAFFFFFLQIAKVNAPPQIGRMGSATLLRKFCSKGKGEGGKGLGFTILVEGLRPIRPPRTARSPVHPAPAAAVARGLAPASRCHDGRRRGALDEVWHGSHLQARCRRT